MKDSQSNPLDQSIPGAKTGLRATLLAWRKRRRKKREAGQFLRETERMVKASARTLTSDTLGKITTQQGSLREALAADDLMLVERAAKALDELVERHLSKYRKSQFREYLESIVLAVLVALTLRALVVEAFKIPSGSMIPTLEIGDQIFVNKFIYGFRVPFTFIKFLPFAEPARGEIIVFIYPRDHSKDYIKRVVGLPGETIEVKDGQILINHQALPHTPSGKPCEYWDYHEFDGWRRTGCESFNETLGTHQATVLAAASDRHTPDFGPEVIQPGHVFVMGDNRDNSSDSRVWGQVPYENIKGRAMFIWWAWNHNGPNFERFFKWID